MGDEADDILGSMGLTDEEKNYATVRLRFDRHFVKQPNIIFERAKFNQCQQEEGESVDSFITSLNVLAEHCGYWALHDEMSLTVLSSDYRMEHLPSSYRWIQN